MCDGKILAPTDDRAVAHCKKLSGHVVDMVVASHSLPEHAMLFSYLNWLFVQLKDQYDDPEAFRWQVSLDVDHAKIMRVKMEMDKVNQLSVQCSARGGMVDLRVPKSWSFKKSHWKEFDDLTNRVSAWGEDHAGIGIAEWKMKHKQFLGA